jgi:glutamine amidotransferase
MEVVIIKYNAGNICSVDYALKRLGITAEITDDAERIGRAEKVIFPGVGEANTTMSYLRERRLDEVIRNLRQPVLGICIGMQLLCRHSEEGDADCIGVFDAEVKRFVSHRHEDKIPHMGWNTVGEVSGGLFQNVQADSFVYFVHSYYVPVNGCTSAVTEYTQRFSSGLEKENFYATQFHPEKSGSTGELILRNFLKL